MNRALFLQQLQMGTAGIIFSPYAQFQDQPELLDALLGKVGLQLFSVPGLLGENFETGAALLHDLGFSSLETFGPYSFSSETAKRSFEGLANSLGLLKSGLYGLDPDTFKAQIDPLKVRSMHTDLDTLEKHLGALATSAHKLGANYVVLPMIPDELRGDLESYKKIADRFNAIGRACQKEGLRFAYHNHGFGFKPQGDTVPFHYLMQNTDANAVFLEMDIFWTTAAGQDPIQLLKQYPNRYKLMHLKDMATTDQKIDDSQGMMGLFAFFGKIRPCGSGVIDLKTIIPRALKAGVEHFFVEHDMAPNPSVNLRSSTNYLLGKSTT